MSVEAMKLATITGPASMVDTAIRKLVIDREFHPENAIEYMAPFKKLTEFSEVNPYSEPLASAVEALRLLKLKPDFRDFSSMDADLDSIADYTEGLCEKIHALDSEISSLKSSAKYNEELSIQLSHFSGLDVELKSLLGLSFVRFRFGRVPEDEYYELKQRVDERMDVFYIPSSSSEHWVYGCYFALMDSSEQVDSMFLSHGFERIRLEVNGEDTDNTLEHLTKLYSEQSADDLQRIKELEDERSAMVSEKDELLRAYSWLRFNNEAFNMRSYAGKRHGKFYLVGWVPRSLAEDFAKECESCEGLICSVSSARENQSSPPVKLSGGFLSKIYEPFVEMFGLPVRGEFDPRLFMAITYTLLFGVMFGDVGQGFLLIIVGFLMWKLKGMWLGRIVSLCGVSAIIFGFVYGSVFGNEHLLPGFKVLEDGNTMKILLVAVAIGVVLILICMIMNIITGIRQKDIKKIFFDPNGVAGFILYAGIAGGVVGQALFGVNMFTLPYILLVIVLPVFLIFAATPLTKLLTGQKDWLPESIGMFIVEGFFELFETALSYVSNTVSFLRVGAFAISHAGMMMVVYLLSQGSDGYSIPGLIFGNLLVTGLETVLVCIQVMRLEFYEMFGRFYKSGGVKYGPKTIDYKTV